MAKILSVLGTGYFLLPAYIFIVIYLQKRNFRRLAYQAGLTAVTGLLLGWLLKDVFRRGRPLGHLVNGAGGYSFPSGHALGGFIFCGIVLYLLWKTGYSFYKKWILSVLVLLFGFGIGLSRIYLHVHYATDVLGSLLIAVWWLSFMHLVFRFVFGNTISPLKGPYERAFYPVDYYLNN